VPRRVDGPWISDDGHWRWDGQAWQPIQAEARPSEPPPPPRRSMPVWRVLLLFIGLAVAVLLLLEIGWLVAIAGALLVMASLARPGLRRWPGWRQWPGLSGSRPALAFAAVLALYTVAAPLVVWGVARPAAGSGAPSARPRVASAPGHRSPSLTSPTTPATSPTPIVTPTPTPTPTPIPPPPTPAPAPAPVATAAPAGCYPLSNSGRCYLPGEFCRTSDHGATGVAANGEPIRCVDRNGWRWEPA